VGKPSKSEGSDTQASEVRRGAEYFSSEDFRRNCEVVKLVVVLQQYSTFTQQRVTQPLKIRDRPRHCLNYSSCSTCCTGTGVSQRYRRPNRQQRAVPFNEEICLGNSVRSTGPTEAVTAVSFKPESSRQQRRGTGPTETVLGNSKKRPKSL
jgi:hypothetical protein